MQSFILCKFHIHMQSFLPHLSYPIQRLVNVVDFGFFWMTCEIVNWFFLFLKKKVHFPPFLVRRSFCNHSSNAPPDLN
jgi:hypothetical protein